MLASPEAEAASLSRLQGGQASPQRRALSLDTLKKVSQKTPSGSAVRYSARMPASKHSGSIIPAWMAGSRTPATIAINVFLMKPSTRSGLFASTYPIRGATRTCSNLACRSSGYSCRPISALPPAARCKSTWHQIAS